MYYLKTIFLPASVYLKSREIQVLVGVALVSVVLMNLLFSRQDQTEKTIFSNLELLLHLHNLVVPFSAYVVQRIEAKNRGLKRFAWLPVSFGQLFMQRTALVFLFSGAFWLTSLVSLSVVREARAFSEVMGYLPYLLLPMSSYLLLVSACSLFTNSLGMGVAQVLIFFFLSFVNFDGAVPFSYSLESISRVSINSIFQEKSVYWGDDMFRLAKVNILATTIISSLVYLAYKKVNLLHYMIRKA